MTKPFREFAYKNLTFNTPLSEDHAALLITQVSSATRILDLGCGWAELLLRMLIANPDATGEGYDTDKNLINRAIVSAVKYGIQDRVTFHCADATTAAGEFDLIICIGVTHIWGDVASTQKFLQPLLTPNGKILFGTGIWLKPRSSELKEIFGDLPTSEELVNTIRTTGFNSIYTKPASLDEWDEFETRWRSGLETSGDAELIAFAEERKREYEEGYRGVLGFEYVVLT